MHFTILNIIENLQKKEMNFYKVLKLLQIVKFYYERMSLFNDIFSISVKFNLLRQSLNRNFKISTIRYERSI